MGSEDDWYTRMMAARADYYEAYLAHAASVSAGLTALDRRAVAQAEYKKAEVMWLCERHNALARP